MRCNICYLPIHEEISKILCPRCTNSFHRDHLAAWLLNEKTCPACREILSDLFREDLRPKTEKERRRLEQILYTLDGLGDVLENWETSRSQKKRLKEMRKLEPSVSDTSFFSLLKYIIPMLGLGISVILIVIILLSNL